MTICPLLENSHPLKEKLIFRNNETSFPTNRSGIAQNRVGGGMGQEGWDTKSTRKLLGLMDRVIILIVVVVVNIYM